MRYGSVSSGIECAAIAFAPLGWEPAFLAEIDPFASTVLHHHHSSGRPRFMPSPEAEGIGAKERKARRAAIKAVAALPERANGCPNYGDMTTYEEWPDAVIDVLIGGTPCQTYSVAGLRAGLDDPRGDLTLTYAAIARKFRPRWTVWENVYGVLSHDRGRSFASLLGLLSGRRVETPKGGWKSAGIVEGYDRAYGLAWRVLDTQFVRIDGFGRAIPQRRRRVFVVGYLGDWRRAAAVLFEREGLSGNPPPRREAGKDSAARTGFSVTGSLTSGFGSKSGTDELASGNVIAAAHVSYVRCEEIEQRTRIDGNGCWVWTNRLTKRGYGQIQKDGKFHQAHRYSYELSKGDIPEGLTIDHLCKNRACVNPAHLEAVNFTTNNLRSNSVGGVNSRKTHCDKGHPFDEQNTRIEKKDGRRTCRACKRDEAQRRRNSQQLEAYGGNNCSGPIAAAASLAAHGGPAGRMDFASETFVVANPLRAQAQHSHRLDSDNVVVAHVAHSLRAEGFDASEDGSGRGIPLTPVSVALRGREGGGTAELGGDVAHTIRASSGGGDKPHVLIPFDTTQITSPQNYSSPKDGDPSHPLSAQAHPPAMAFNWQSGGDCRGLDLKDFSQTLTKEQTPAMVHGWAVRRLTPRECCRLQGVPDDYFDDVVWRGKSPPPDGPIYKTLGNGFSANAVRWIGRRIEMVEQILQQKEAAE